MEFISLSPRSVRHISLLNTIRFHQLLEALGDPCALLARVDRFTSSIFGKFPRISGNVCAFGGLVLEHAQDLVLYDTAPLSFIYYEF